MTPDFTNGLVLEHFLEHGGVIAQIPLAHFPFRLGRNADADYVVPTRDVSKFHAELFCRGQQIYLRDLNSTNGSYVNGTPVVEEAVHPGDIIQLANAEFRLVAGMTPRPAYEENGTLVKSPKRANNIYYQNTLCDILRRNGVRAVFQPIVDLRSRAVLGYEALGRTISDELHIDIAQLFAVAQKSGAAADLSRIFREAAFQDVRKIPGVFSLFVNVHASEVQESGLIAQLRRDLDLIAGRCPVILEIHEDTIADCNSMRQFRQEVQEYGLRIAYDDFGAGQARLAEFAEAPPDFVKLDMKLVRGINESPARQDLVKALCVLADKQGVTVIAEGLETAAELDTCAQLGCHLGQGYFLGRPRSVAALGPVVSRHEVAPSGINEYRVS